MRKLLLNSFVQFNLGNGITTIAPSENKIHHTGFEGSYFCKYNENNGRDKKHDGDTNQSIAHSILNNRHHLLYGRILHKVLEDAVKGRNIDKMHMHPLIATTSCELQNKIITKLSNLQINPEFVELVTKNVITEVNIGIDELSNTKIGRIDLMAIDEDKITIVDYKSDQYFPKTQNLVPKAYV